MTYNLVMLQQNVLHCVWVVVDCSSRLVSMRVAKTVCLHESIFALHCYSRNKHEKDDGVSDRKSSCKESPHDAASTRDIECIDFSCHGRPHLVESTAWTMHVSRNGKVYYYNKS